MSLIEEALRRQQEQERARIPNTVTPSSAQIIAGSEPPPLPSLPVATTKGRAVELSSLGEPRKYKNLLAPLIVVGMASAGLTWWLISIRHTAAQSALQSARISPVKIMDVVASNTPRAVISHGTSETVIVTGAQQPLSTPIPVLTNQSLTVIVNNPPLTPAPVPTPPGDVVVVSNSPATLPRHQPASAVPAEPWPKFTLKGRVTFGGSFALVLGSGQILEVGDQTATGIQLESATADRIRLSFRTQTRDYRLQAGTFVLLPPSDTIP